MREKPGEGTEEDEKGRGRHSNLPFDETRNLGRLEKIPAPAGIRRRVLSVPRPRSVSSGRSPGFRILRRRAPSRTRDRFPIRRVQWFIARGVPGDSGGGRAGFSPASLGQTTQRSVEEGCNHNVNFPVVQVDAGSGFGRL